MTTVITPTLMMSRRRIEHLYANGMQRSRVSESGPRAKGQMSRRLTATLDLLMAR
jgi:hypothetical protein